MSNINIPTNATAKTKASDNTMTNQSVTNPSLVVDERPSDVFVNAGAVQSVNSAKLKTVNDMTEAEAILNGSIEAKPLMQPEGLALSILRNEYAYRWVAFKVRGGENLAKFQYMGFEKATLQDVKPHSEKAASNPDGIIIGDLLLMKIPKAIYFAHLKDNYRKANLAATRMGQSVTDAEKIRSLFPNGIPRDGSGNPVGSFYKPGDQEIAQKLSSNSINIAI